MTATTVHQARTPRAALLAGMEGLVAEYRGGLCDDGWVMLHLREHRPDLSPWQRWALWEDLAAAHEAWERAEAGDVEYGALDSDLADPVVYAERTRVLLDELLDQVAGGGR